MQPHSLVQARAALRRGATTSRKIVEDALARIADPAGEGARAFVEHYPDEARREADRADALRAAGTELPLLGLPISVKDLFDLSGRTTTAGSVVLRDAPAATADATVVRRLRAAGAVVVGRTNMTEFAFSGIGLNPHYGTPRNPYERDIEGGRIPGGSSSGAAVSVTDGMALGAIGSDTGGSVRIPAALCGLAGFKPTQARVPLEGAYPLSTALDSVGPLAASVDDCILLDRVLSGEDGAIPAVGLAGVSLAVPTTYVLTELDDKVTRAFGRALDSLSGAGARITELSVPPLDRLPELNRIGTFPGLEAYAAHHVRLATDGHRYDPRVRARIEAGGHFGVGAMQALQEARAAMIRDVAGLLSPFDAIVMPTVPMIAPRIATLDEDAPFDRANLLMLRNPTVVNFIDGCAASVPCHRPGDAPVGLMIAGLSDADARILSIARAVEARLRER